MPSVAIGIRKSGHTLFEEAFGFADVERQIPATVDTPYSIASITKPMIATLISQAAAEGKIDINAPIENYLSGAKLTAWAGNPEDATVRRVAHHVAGLPTHCQFHVDGEDHPAPSWRDTVSRYGNIVREPGSAYCYSNIGFGFLGFALEQVYEGPLAQLCRERLFNPIGMDRSSFADRPVDELRAVRYDHQNKPLPYYVTDHPAGSEAYSSIRDLLAFGEFHLNPERTGTFDPAAVAAMRDPGETTKFDIQYGLGWGLTATDDGRPVFGHTGGMDGVTSRLLMFPTEDLVIAILSNRDSSIMFDCGSRIYEMLGVSLRRNTPAEPDKSVPIQATGNWLGTVHTYVGSLRFNLGVSSNGTIELNWNGHTISHELSFANGKLVGTADCQIQTPDTEGRTHKMGFEVAFHEGNGVGVVTAWCEKEARVGNSIPYPVTLKEV